MNRAEAKRVAHAAIAALIQVNAEAGEGDLFADMEDLDEDDRARVDLAIDEIQGYHSRMAR